MLENKKHIYRYLTVSDEDKNLGIYVLGAGLTKVNKESTYPLIDHPIHRYFHLSKGRRLLEYQILYITSGKGVFESEATGKQDVKAGDLFILFPNIWHRFSPDKKTGWHEYWIEFNGKMINYFEKEGFLDPIKPIVSCDLDCEIMDNFLKVIQLVREDELNFQFIASGVLLQILTKIFSYKKFGSTSKSEIETKIKQAKLLIFEYIEKQISPLSISEKVGMGYSSFRKEFKRYTGFSPKQYQIQLRIQKAKTLLSTTELPIKEIAYSLGFECNNYFSRAFKQKTGISPADFRLRNEL
jgi:AraC-like DNA-binding protein